MPKQSFSIVPVVRCVSMIMDREMPGYYTCPVYKTVDRMNTYVFPAQLKTKYPPAKWIISGVAMVLDVPGAADAFGPCKEPPA